MPFSKDSSIISRLTYVFFFHFLYHFYFNRYYFFYFGTQLGDETWYSIFFCFWFWNIDGAVGRRLMLVWNLIMYIGQGIF